MFWFMKAWAYSSTCKYIWKEISKVQSSDCRYKTNNPELVGKVIRSTPYISGIAAELFMKGYLIYKEEKPVEVRKLDHNLKLIREKCASFGDKRFLNDDLIFLTDTCGEHLMEDGGIRYPDKHEMPIYITVFEKALNVLQELSSEVSNVLVKFPER
ncbi:hypothetical protein KBC89_02535 [Candidatus Woesebacteria bacterium]|nr:hypothetical protein [Candidatus Woesebacteria bacterium]